MDAKGEYWASPKWQLSHAIRSDSESAEFGRFQAQCSGWPYNVGKNKGTLLVTISLMLLIRKDVGWSGDIGGSRNGEH